MSKKIYFASDFHLGMDALLSSFEREKKIVAWLDKIAPEAEMLFLVGDVFDYWFEYKHAIPKGFTRLLGKLAEMTDAGVSIHFFTGNHDMWMFRYLSDQMGIPVHRKPVRMDLMGQSFLIGHGDGLGPGDRGYKLLKKVLANPVCQGAFKWVHPDIGLSMMRFFSSTSRNYTGNEDAFGTEKEEWLWQYAESSLVNMPTDFFVFGHRHLPIDVTLRNGKSRYINLGEWMYACSYGVWDGRDFSIQFFDSAYTRIFTNRS
jgi:UDP-2,3-diacylglucosamine hydrolase